MRRKDAALEMLDEMRLPHFRSIIREYVMHTDAPLSGDVVTTYPRSRAAVNAIDDDKDVALEFLSGAAMKEVERLEAKYNNGKPFPRVGARELPQGRPMGE